MAAASSAWVIAFVLFQIACQLALLVPMFASMRIVVRVAVFGAGLVFLFVVPGRGAAHPAARAAFWVLGIIVVSFFHPHTNATLSGAAQACMYAAILSPLFWVPRVQASRTLLPTVLMILCVFHSVSAGFGILQVYFPGRFQPALSSSTSSLGEGYLYGLYIVTAGGERVFRPMGLTDIPGGAAGAGFHAVLLSMAFFVVERRAWRKAAFICSMMLGMACLYLCQIRSTLVMLGFCVMAFVGILAWRGERRRAVLLASLAGVIGLFAFTWAVALAGASVANRVASLLEESPHQVYYKNRGIFLTYTFKDLIPRYPLGAGLGRWGMMNSYFGDNTDPDRAIIPAIEIQWAAWTVDGGVPLILAYTATLFIAARVALRVALDPAARGLWLWGAVVFAYDLGACALAFSYPLFIGQSGLEFWLLNALLHGATRANTGPRPIARPDPTV